MGTTWDRTPKPHISGIRGALTRKAQASRCHATLQRDFAGFTRRLIAIPRSGDRSAPSLLDRNARNPTACWTAGRTYWPAKVRFIRLRQRPGEILDAIRPQEGEHRPRSITAGGICGQNERRNTQKLRGWTRESVTRGQKGRGCVGSQLAGRSGREAKRAAAPGLGGSCGAQPPTHLRHQALDLDS